MMHMERMSDSKEATMSTTTSSELARAWAERVRAGTFSPAVAGTREVRVFGQAGCTAFCPRDRRGTAIVANTGWKL